MEPVQHEHRLERGEREDEEEAQEEDDPDPPVAQGVANLIEVKDAGRGSSLARRLDEVPRAEDRCRKRERRGKETRCLRRHRRELAADPGTEGEAESERRADQPHALRPVLGRRHVGDVGLRRRDVRAEKPRAEARNEEKGHRVREREQRVGRRGSEEAADEHGLASDAVRESAPHRGEKELHPREAPEQEPELALARPVGPRIERQERDHDPEPEKVDEDRQEDQEQRGATRSA